MTIFEPSKSVSSPAIILRKDDFPDPFIPMIPILALSNFFSKNDNNLEATPKVWYIQLWKEFFNQMIVSDM
jgi:hypothetical protein